MAANNQTTFKDFLPLLYLGGVLIGIQLIKSGIVLLKGKEESSTSLTDTGNTIPTTTGGKVCKSSYTKEEVKALFPKWIAQIKAAKGVFSDDYPAVIDVIAKIRNKGDYYLLSNLFAAIYKQNMMAYLESFLNADEMRPINNKLSKLKC